MPAARSRRPTLPGLLAALALALLAPAHAQDAAAPGPALDPAAALRTSQAAIGTTIGDYTLLDREGRPVRLASYRGKPLLVNFIYTGCFQVCPTSTRAMLEALRAMRGSFDESQFNVVSIGFNLPADSPEAMKAFALQQRIATPNWEFLSPHAASVAALTRDFGFEFRPSQAGFDHLLQVSVVDAQGRLAAQVYGDDFSADRLGEPLRLLLREQPLPPPTSLAEIVDRVRVLCSVYDPATGTYRVSYALAFEIAGGITFAVAMLWFFALEWRDRRRARRVHDAAPAARHPALPKAH
jgi:protein SCO1